MARHGQKQCCEQQPGSYGQIGITQPGTGGEAQGSEIHADEEQTVFRPFRFLAGKINGCERQTGHQLKQRADERPVDMNQPKTRGKRSASHDAEQGGKAQESGEQQPTPSGQQK